MYSLMGKGMYGLISVCGNGCIYMCGWNVGWNNDMMYDKTDEIVYEMIKVKYSFIYFWIYYLNKTTTFKRLSYYVVIYRFLECIAY